MMRTVNKHTYDCDVSRARDEMMDAVTRPNERTNEKGTAWTRGAG